MMPNRIQLSRARGWRKPADAIVVARPSKWGNPITFSDVGGQYPSLNDLQLATMIVRRFIEHGGTTRVDVVHLVLSAPRPLTVPLPIGGALGLWSVGPWREVLVREAVIAS